MTLNICFWLFWTAESKSLLLCDYKNNIYICIYLPTQSYFRNNEKKPLFTSTRTVQLKQGFFFGKTAHLHSKSSLFRSKTWKKKWTKYSKTKKTESVCLCFSGVHSLTKKWSWTSVGAWENLYSWQILPILQIFSLSSFYDASDDTGSYRLKLQV